MVEQFTQGNPELVRKLNIMVRELNDLNRMQGDPLIRITQNPGAGVTFRLDVGEVIKRIPRYRGSGGGGLRRAFVETEPSSGTTLGCFLDIDNGDQINVECTIYDDDGAGGSFAGDVRPKVSDGCPLWVVYNNIDSEWQNVTPIFQVGEC